MPAVCSSEDRLKNVCFCWFTCCATSATLFTFGPAMLANSGFNVLLDIGIGVGSGLAATTAANAASAIKDTCDSGNFCKDNHVAPVETDPLLQSPLVPAYLHTRQPVTLTMLGPHENEAPPKICCHPF